MRVCVAKSKWMSGWTVSNLGAGIVLHRVGDWSGGYPMALDYIPTNLLLSFLLQLLHPTFLFIVLYQSSQSNHVNFKSPRAFGYLYIEIVTTLRINIAKGTSQRIRRLLNSRNRHAHIPQIYLIAQRCIPARWHIVQRNRPAKRILPVRQVQMLPVRVRPIDHGVVQKEEWIPWGCEQIASWVAADGEVAA